MLITTTKFKTSIIQVRQISGFFPKSSGVIGNSVREISSRDRNTSSRISGFSTKSSTGMKSENYTDDNSDAISVADSLDGSSSSRISMINHDDRPVRGDLPTMITREITKTMKPPDSFFVPMKTDIQTDIKSVSDYLPKKLKEKILQRQQDLQEKLNQSKSSSATNSPTKQPWKKIHQKSNSSIISNLRQIGNKVRYRRPILPSLTQTKKFKKEEDELNREKLEKLKKSKAKNNLKRKSKETIQSSKNSKLVDNSNKRNFHLYKTENEYSYDGGPRRIYHKTEFRNSNKRIEILEIMECLEISETPERVKFKRKSRIPVLLNPKPGLTETVTRKPTYLDFEKVVITDPKLDQLIANILINTLNEKNETISNLPVDHPENISQESVTLNKPHSTIDTERSHQESSKTSNENKVKMKTTDEFNKHKLPKSYSNSLANNNYKGRAAIEELRTETTSTIPDGWVAFYVPQKNEDFLDNATNEGRTYDTQKVDTGDSERLRQTEDKSFPSVEVRKREPFNENYNECYNFEKTLANERSELFKRVTIPPPQVPGRLQQPNLRSRHRSLPNGHSPPGDWSIVLSGTNGAAFTPDLEMKIRFPAQHINYPSSQMMSEVEDDRENSQMFKERTRFPRIENKYFNGYRNAVAFNSTNSCGPRILPEIENKRLQNNLQVSDSISQIRAMDITDMRPRQTKTSLKRYNMTRPRLHPLFESNINDINVDRQYPEILRRFPQLLSVNGNSVSPERKPYVPGFSRSNIPKHNCLPHTNI